MKQNYHVVASLMAVTISMLSRRGILSHSDAARVRFNRPWIGVT